MTTYTIEGQDFDAPDEMTMPDVVDAYGRWKASQAPEKAPQASQKAPEATTPQEARTLHLILTLAQIIPTTFHKLRRR
mgnify:CR=1 FL=1